METKAQDDDALTRARPSDWVEAEQLTPTKRLARARKRLRGALMDLDELAADVPRLREVGWALDAMARCVYVQLTSEYWDVAVKAAEGPPTGSGSEDTLAKACRELAGAKG